MRYDIYIYIYIYVIRRLKVLVHLSQSALFLDPFLILHPLVSDCTGKGKGHLRTGHEGPEGE